jgi:hypothetical protein
MSSDVILSPNMQMPVPIVNVDPGPDWANNINASLSIVDGHNHAPPTGGIPINPDGMFINADLTFNDNNATNLRSVRFFPQLTPLVLPADLGCLYESGVDLYYNDGNGTVIRMTALGAVTGAAGTITGLPSGTASAAFSAVSGTFVFQQATSTAANMDIGTLILRFPGSYPTPAGNFIALEVPSTISSGYALILPTIPPMTEVMTLNTAGQMATITYDQVGQGMTPVGADAIAETMDATGANAIAASITRPVPGPDGSQGNVVISLSSGSFGINNISTLIPNLTVGLNTSGRPVMIMIIPDGTSSPASLVIPNNTQVTFQIANTNTGVSFYWNIATGSSSGGGIFAPLFSFVDTSMSGRTVASWEVLASTNNSSIVFIQFVKLLAYEL